AGLQRQDRRLHLPCAVRRARRITRRGIPVEPDRTGETVAARSGEPRVAAAETEADGEDAVDPEPAEVVDRSRDIRLHAFRRRLLDVRHVFEVVAALVAARSPAEVDER